MRRKKKNNRGSILPIVLLSVVLTQICFYSIHQVYRNQMETYHLLREHYQSQTILALSEKYVKEEGQVKSTLQYNIGKVTVIQFSEDKLRLVSLLPSGFSEERIMEHKE